MTQGPTWSHQAASAPGWTNLNPDKSRAVHASDLPSMWKATWKATDLSKALFFFLLFCFVICVCYIFSFEFSGLHGMGSVHLPLHHKDSVFRESNPGVMGIPWCYMSCISKSHHPEKGQVTCKWGWKNGEENRGKRREEREREGKLGKRRKGWWALWRSLSRVRRSQYCSTQLRVAKVIWRPYFGMRVSQKRY